MAKILIVMSFVGLLEAFTAVYNEIEYRVEPEYEYDLHGMVVSFVVKTKDQEAWESFDMYGLSNNHLISDDSLIREQVKDIRIGDQIRVRGFLASYGSEGGGTRGTSTTRLDTGDGACETLYVENFEIVRAATSGWRN